MHYQVSLKLKADTFQQFQQIHQQINQAGSAAQAKILGENFAKIACEIIDQAFGQLVTQSGSADAESGKVLKQVKDSVAKYMPWSVSFFGNERLAPMVNHVQGMMAQRDGQAFIAYPVEQALVSELLSCIAKMREGKQEAVLPGLKAFTQIVDQGVSSLVREPKSLLKFNVVVDKTLNGVIHLTTQLAYKRFEKISTLYPAQQITGFFDHFFAFLTDNATTQDNALN